MTPEMAAIVPRDYSLRVRLAGEEKNMLEALALAEGITVSDWIRIRVRREFLELAETAKPKPKRSKK